MMSEINYFKLKVDLKHELLMVCPFFSKKVYKKKFTTKSLQE